jgi:hypothetical protein
MPVPVVLQDEDSNETLLTLAAFDTFGADQTFGDESMGFTVPSGKRLIEKEASFRYRTSNDASTYEVAWASLTDREVASGDLRSFIGFVPIGTGNTTNDVPMDIVFGRETFFFMDEGEEVACRWDRTADTGVDQVLAF